LTCCVENPDDRVLTGSVRRGGEAGSGVLEFDDSCIALAAPQQTAAEVGARDPFALVLFGYPKLLGERTQPLRRIHRLDPSFDRGTELAKLRFDGQRGVSRSPCILGGHSIGGDRKLELEPRTEGKRGPQPEQARVVVSSEVDDAGAHA
jgi:hypothetical protein